jgi:hypothetical protein
LIKTCVNSGNWDFLISETVRKLRNLGLYYTQFEIKYLVYVWYMIQINNPAGCRAHDLLSVGFTALCAISAYHH